MRLIKDIAGAVTCLVIIGIAWWLMQVSSDSFCPDIKIIYEPLPDHGCQTDIFGATIFYATPIIGAALIALTYWALGERGDH